jgi:transcriptional regulator with XRE-family HTH domain
VIDMSNDARRIFAENLAKYLERSGKTQTELAEYMGCSSSTVSDWYNGNKYPRPDKMQRISEFLGVQMSDLQKPHDPLDEIDIGFYGEYKALDERDKETVRDMVRVMRERRACQKE